MPFLLQSWWDQPRVPQRATPVLARYVHFWDDRTMIFRALALTVPLFMITGCTNSVQVGPVTPASMVTSASSWTLYQGSPSPAPSSSWTPDTVASGTFLPYRPSSTAITYDPAVVPAGATATVAVAQTSGSTEVRLEASGLIPRRTYGAHLHTE